MAGLTSVPTMKLAEVRATTHFRKIAGRTGIRTAWVIARPCRAPHQTIFDVRLIGGDHTLLRRGS
jgi:predicted ATPase with chaperone activity